MTTNCSCAECQRRYSSINDSLIPYLTPTQRTSVLEDGTFTVTGSAGGRFRINVPVRHVYLLGQYAGREEAYAYCVSIGGAAGNELTDGQVALGFMLWLRANEPEFRRRANLL